VKWIEGQRAPIPSVENFARKLQSIVCPTPAKAADQGHQSIRTLSAVEVKKHVDARTLQRLVHVVSDGGMPLSRTEVGTRTGCPGKQCHTNRLLFCRLKSSSGIWLGTSLGLFAVLIFCG
jgi:hypothetical protein